MRRCGGREVLSNVISSDIDSCISFLAASRGGIAQHIEKINEVIEEALSEAQVTLDDLDAVG